MRANAVDIGALTRLKSLNARKTSAATRNALVVQNLYFDLLAWPVSGTCKENISISHFDRLVLQASPSATLQDASNGNAPVVDIVSSSDVTLQGFKISGGAAGVACRYFSFCTLNLNEVQRSSGPGVFFGRSEGLLQNNNIANNAGRGITGNASKLQTYANTISNNGASGIALDVSNLTATSDAITSNAIFGVRLFNNSVVLAYDLTITSNSNSGVRLESASTASFEQINTGNVITGNGGLGVSVNDLSFAGFVGTNTVTSNLTQPDVACNPQYSATRGAGTVGGTTNCPN
jgi:hypothetical protein